MSNDRMVFHTFPLEENFVRLPHEVVRNKKLSFKARGVLALLLSNSAEWQTYAGWIQEQGTEGREAIQGAIQELEEAGHMRYRDTPREAGKFTVSAWEVHATAVPINRLTNRTKWREKKTGQNFKKIGENHQREAVNGEPETGNRERQTVNGFPTAKNEQPKERTTEEESRTPVPPPAARSKPPEQQRAPAPEPRPSASSGGTAIPLEFAEIVTGAAPPNDARNMPEPEPPEFIVQKLTPAHRQIAEWFNRRESTKWSEKELRAFKKAKPTTEDLATLEPYYTAPKDAFPDGRDYRRRDILTLLNNWPGEVDRARKYNLTLTPKADGEYTPAW